MFCDRMYPRFCYRKMQLMKKSAFGKNSGLVLSSSFIIPAAFNLAQNSNTVGANFLETLVYSNAQKLFRVLVPNKLTFGSVFLSTVSWILIFLLGKSAFTYFSDVAPAAKASINELNKFWGEVLSLRKNSFPTKEDFFQELNKVENILKEEPCMLSLKGDADTFVIGDIHSNVAALEFTVLKFLKEIARGNKRARILFLGDYVDRGQQGPGGGNGIKVLYILMKLKNLLPNNVFLLRGNHEEDIGLNSQNIMGVFNFYCVMMKLDPNSEEAEKSFNENIVNKLYKNLPICIEFTSGKKKYFAAHGGPPVLVGNRKNIFEQLKSTKNKEKAFSILPENRVLRSVNNSVISRVENNFQVRRNDDDFINYLEAHLHTRCCNKGYTIESAVSPNGEKQYYFSKMPNENYDFCDSQSNSANKNSPGNFSVGKQLLWNDYGGEGFVSNSGNYPDCNDDLVNGRDRGCNQSRGTAAKYFSGDLEKIKEETGYTNFISAHCHDVEDGYEKNKINNGVEISRVMCSPNMKVGENRNGHVLLVKEKTGEVEDFVVQYDNYWRKKQSNFSLPGATEKYFTYDDEGVKYTEQTFPQSLV